MLFQVEPRETKDHAHQRACTRRGRAPRERGPLSLKTIKNPKEVSPERSPLDQTLLCDSAASETQWAPNPYVGS